MSQLITFNRAASAEFSEATAWYESKRIGLGKEFYLKKETARHRRCTTTGIDCFSAEFGRWRSPPLSFTPCWPRQNKKNSFRKIYI